MAILTAETVVVRHPEVDETRRHRADIQGLRALAVLAVVAYHAGIPGISGGFVGVDFFFVLSGYLITGLLISERKRTGRVSLRGFWARRARRLIPASATVLAVTALASAVWIPLLERRAVAGDIRWAALFSANWRFAIQQSDYLAHDRSPSPVLHLWSLGVEEQFYLVWPLLIALVGYVAVTSLPRLQRLDRTYFRVFAVACVLSFAYCVFMTNVAQPFAFFGTPERAWQLGIGACLATGVGAFRILTARARMILGVLGLAGYAVALVVLSETGVNGLKYPGLLALLPTFAAAALIVAGTGDTVLTRALSVRPLHFVGDLSYSWYLWHWPVLVILPLVVGSDAWSWRLAAVVLSFGLAVASYRLIEQPMRRASVLVRSPSRSLLMGAGFIGVAFVAASVLASSATTDAKVETGTGQDVTIRPNPLDASSDVVSMRDLGCDLDYAQSDPNTSADCTFGDPAGDKQMIVIGDSHAVAMYPGLDEVAAADGWRLDSWTKSACPYADVTKYDPVVQGPFKACDEYRDNVERLAIEAHPDLVVLAMLYNPAARIIDRSTGHVLSTAEARQATIDGMRATIQRFTGAGIPVMVVEDLPLSADFSPPSCLVEKTEVGDCLVPNPSTTPVEQHAVAGLPDVALFDLRQGVCDVNACTPVVGDVLVYRDSNHITRTYALTLADRLRTTIASLPVTS